MTGRPKNPRIGTIGFNIDTNSLDVWDGKMWMRLLMKRF
jgi:hypothetical protein